MPITMPVNQYSCTVLSTSLEKYTAPSTWVYLFRLLSVIFFFKFTMYLLTYCYIVEEMRSMSPE